MTDQQLIEQFAAGADRLATSIRELGQPQLLAVPVPGTWSIQQIVIHLMDSDLIGTDRMKRVIAEDNPILIGYNETLFAQRLFPELLDAGAAAEIFKLNRQLTTVILRQLKPEDFDRVGQHNEAGPKTLRSLISGYIEHLEHHLNILQQKRELVAGGR